MTQPFDDVTVAELLNLLYARRDSAATDEFRALMVKQIAQTIAWSETVRARKLS